MAMVEDVGMVVCVVGGVDGMMVCLVGGVLTSALKGTPLAVNCRDNSEPTEPVDPTIRIVGVMIINFMLQISIDWRRENCKKTKRGNWVRGVEGVWGVSGQGNSWDGNFFCCLDKDVIFVE